MKNIKNAAYNDKLFDSYDKEVDALKFGQYDTNDLPDNKKPYVRAELRVFKKTVQEPIVKYSVVVNLRCVRMNGNVVDRKSDVFYSDEISKIIDRLNWKKGNRFLDNEIWAPLCRVERGKVTNKMRFYIYNRDGYRCCKCHRKTNDLEIDHIWPIAKGGKTTLDNLQTLCHRCNARKGDSVDYEN